MGCFYNWLWQVYRYGKIRFKEMPAKEQLKLYMEFVGDCAQTGEGEAT